MLLFCLCVLFLNVLAGNTHDKFEQLRLSPGPFFELAGGFNRGEKLEIYFFTKFPGLELRLSEKPSMIPGVPIPLAVMVLPHDPPLIQITHRNSDQTAWNEAKKRPLDYFGWDDTCECYEGMITILRKSTGGYEISFNTHKGPFHYTSKEESMITTFLVIREAAIVGVKLHRAGKKPISMMLSSGQETPRPPEEHILKRIRDWESVKAQPFKISFNPHFPIHEVMHFFDNDDNRGLVENKTIHICIWDMTPLDGESFWIANTNYPFMERNDRELSLAFEIDIKQRTAILGFRYRSIDIPMTTQRLSMRGHGNEHLCFRFGTRRSNNGIAVFWADGIFGKAPVGQDGVRLKAAWLSFTGKFGPDQTKVAISWKTPGSFLKSPERKYWKTPNCRHEHMKRFSAVVEEYEKLEREEALKRRLRYQTDGNQTTDGDLEIVMLNQK